MCKEGKYKKRGEKDKGKARGIVTPSYEGCHPAIADALKKGQHIMCDCGYGDRAVIVAYVDGDYLDEDTCTFGTAKPLPQMETRVKGPLALMRALLDKGYTVTDSGSWISSNKSAFVSGMWKYCSKPKPIDCTWNKEWLEEVEKC